MADKNSRVTRTSPSHLFHIEHLDRFAQGVSKGGGEIYFIPKTLPGEKGEAEVISSKKGVNFSRLIKIEQNSQERVLPTCPHYQYCSGCHYLHTSYDQEVEFKKTQFTRMLHFIKDAPSLNIHAAAQRNSYRNRIQLHYRKRDKKIGFLTANRNILPVPYCQLPIKELQIELTNLYATDDIWDELRPHPAEGHIELYQYNEQIVRTFNQQYAHGGFTQVNEQQNQLCLQQITRLLQKAINGREQLSIIDLFGGNGNLTREITNQTIQVIDATPNRTMLTPWQYYHCVNLYHAKVIDQLKKLKTDCDILVLDPPRSGLKNIDKFIKLWNPEQIIYLSCDPTTLVRDLKKLSSYQVDEVHLFDFFPSTYHWESLITLKK